MLMPLHICVFVFCFFSHFGELGTSESSWVKPNSRAWRSSGRIFIAGLRNTVVCLVFTTLPGQQVFNKFQTLPSYHEHGRQHALSTRQSWGIHCRQSQDTHCRQSWGRHYRQRGYKVVNHFGKLCGGFHKELHICTLYNPASTFFSRSNKRDENTHPQEPQVRPSSAAFFLIAPRYKQCKCISVVGKVNRYCEICTSLLLAERDLQTRQNRQTDRQNTTGINEQCGQISILFWVGAFTCVRMQLPKLVERPVSRLGILWSCIYLLTITSVKRLDLKRDTTGNCVSGILSKLPKCLL